MIAFEILWLYHMAALIQGDSGGRRHSETWLPLTWEVEAVAISPSVQLQN